MVEMTSPLASKLQPGTFGAQGFAGVEMGTRSLQTLTQIAGWHDFETAAKPALKAVGLKGLGDYRNVQKSGEVTAWRTAPDRVLLEGADLTQHASDDLMVLDLTHARTVITLQGGSARDVLSIVLAIDTREAALPPGGYAQTVMHQVGVLVQCIGPDQFEILVPSTWSETLWDFLYVNALSFGIIVKGGP